MSQTDPLLLDSTGKRILKQVKRIADNLAYDLGTGYESIHTAEGINNGDRLWKALNKGGRYTGNNKVFKIDDVVCTPGSTGISYVKWWIAYRDTYPEMDDNNADFVIRDCIFEPEGDHAILLQFLYKSGTITFEHCTFHNVLFWFGRNYKQVITFRDCLIEDNQYHFITTGEWNQNAEYHIERCHFRHMRPDFAEYRADVQALKLNGWAHGNIRSMGFDIKWFISDTIFEDCMAQLNIAICASSHAPDNSPKRVEFYMERCTIRKTNGAGISFSGQPVTGWIKDCDFYNIGANRCNEEGYDLPTDKKIMWGSGTEEDPYVYACGVGSNAIFSFNWTPRHELVITGNRMFNMMENGVEGNYRELSYNHIENTGYRMDEGMWNPSTEGIYGNFAICKGNIIRNPYRNEAGIVIASWSDGQACYYEDNVIEFDKGGETNEATGFEIMFQAEKFDYPMYISNNSIRGFSKKFYLYNQYSAPLQNIHIIDQGDTDHVWSTSDMSQRNTMGLDFLSNESREIARDPYFYELNDDGSPKEWRILHGEGGVYTTGTDRFIRIRGIDRQACAVIAQEYHLNSDVYIARIKCQVRTDSGKVGFWPVSVKDDGSLADDVDSLILHPSCQTFELVTGGDKTQFVEITHSMVVSQNCRICIVDPDIEDSDDDDQKYFSKMDVKNISIQLTRCYRDPKVSENDSLITSGKVYDFSNIPSVCLPSNAFGVTYWIPQKNYSYGGSWTDATWMMGRYTSQDEGRGRIIINSDAKLWNNLVCWYKSHFDLELNGHTLECRNADTYSFLSLFNGADVRIKGPGTIKAKNFAVALSIGCTCTVDKDVVIESTGIDNKGQTKFSVVVGGGDADARTVFNIHGGTIGKTLAYAYTDINFDIPEGVTATLERLQTTGQIFVSKNTKVVNGGTIPNPTEVVNPKQMTGLFTCTNITATYQKNHTTEDLSVTGDESVVEWFYIDEYGKKIEGKSSLSSAVSESCGTKNTRNGTFYVKLLDNIYTYTGFWYGDMGAINIDLNGYSIRNNYQSYCFNFNGDCDITFMDSNSRVEGIGMVESTEYCAVISNGVKLHIGRCLIQQKTGICIGGNGEFTIEEEAQLNGKICLAPSPNTKVTLNGGTMTASNFGIQESVGESSSTSVTVHGGTITSGNISISAQNVTFDAVDGKTATLVGSLSLSQYATITDDTQVTVNGEVVKKIQSAKGTVVISKKEVTPPKPADKTLVYKLAESTQFLPAEKDFVDTGIKPFESISAQPTWTLLIDADDFGRLKNLTEDRVLLYCADDDTNDSAGFSIQAKPNGSVEINLFNTWVRMGWYGGSTSKRWNGYIQIKGTQCRIGTDPATDTWQDISGYNNVSQSLLIGASKGTDGTIGHYWDGTLERFEIYNRELTNDEISTWQKS